MDSVLVGPAAGQPGALTATAVRRDRVLVLAPRPVGGLYRFRVFPRDPAMAEHITLTVVERADSLGAVDAGAGLTVLLTR